MELIYWPIKGRQIGCARRARAIKWTAVLYLFHPEGIVSALSLLHFFGGHVFGYGCEMKLFRFTVSDYGTRYIYACMTTAIITVKKVKPRTPGIYEIGGKGEKGKKELGKSKCSKPLAHTAQLQWTLFNSMNYTSRGDPLEFHGFI